jgi:hypothetical protein
LHRREIVLHKPNRVRQECQQRHHCRDVGRERAKISVAPAVEQYRDHQRQQEERRPVFSKHGGRAGNSSQHGPADVATVERAHERERR